MCTQLVKTFPCFVRNPKVYYRVTQSTCETIIKKLKVHKQQHMDFLNTVKAEHPNKSREHTPYLISLCSRHIYSVTEIVMMFLWVVTLCGLIGTDQHFIETYCLHHLPWRWRQYVSLKHWCVPMSPHGITTQRSSTVIFAACELQILQITVL
jgi:hypothetical protein